MEIGLAAKRQIRHVLEGALAARYEEAVYKDQVAVICQNILQVRMTGACFLRYGMNW
jgi:hypothetical protein